MNANPWQLYDDLIDLVPADLRVSAWALGEVALVRDDAGGCGIASRQRGGPSGGDPMPRTGERLRDVAALVKSWDFATASLGSAALNCALNTSARVTALSGSGTSTGDRDVFARDAPRLRGRRVAMVGHFSHGIRALEGLCDLTVLERDPRGDDLPDPACEYVLPACDAVYITGMALANKTLPRLAALSAQARTVLTGPSSPFAPEVLPGWGIDQIAGSWVTDAGLAADLVAHGATMPRTRPATRRFSAALAGTVAVPRAPEALRGRSRR